MVDGVIYDVADGDCVSGGGGGGGFSDPIWRIFRDVGRSFYDVAERDPDWVPIVGGRAGPYLTDPDGVNGPESAPNVTDTTPVIIEGVQAVMSGGTAPVAQTIVKNVAKAGGKQAVQQIAKNNNPFANTRRTPGPKIDFLKQQAKSDKTPTWMKPWLEQGRNPPGYDVDHILPLSVGGAHDPLNMRLVLRADHRIHHKHYDPWNWR
jgi:hypothetical protein